MTETKNCWTVWALELSLER